MPVFVPEQYSFGPRKVHCPLCLAPLKIRLMVGDTHKFICAGCGFMHLGKPDDGRCVKCQCSILRDEGVPGEDEGFPHNAPCPACSKRLADIKAIVQLGGISFRCVSCGGLGAFAKDDPRTIEFKKQQPEKNSCEIDRSTCPQCQHEQQASAGAKGQ